jgi:hypothetical protein
MLAMLENPEQQADEFITEYQRDPIGFMCDVLDVRPEFVWSKMREIAEAVRDNQFTAIKAGHGVSKTYTMARLALWFLLTHYPATVITTAPTYNQVEEILWRELRDAYGNAKVPLGGNLTHTKLEFGDKWFALGLSTRIDTVTSEATRFQGFHNENMMVIFDEAAGVMKEIWRAAQHLLTAGNFRFVAIGNPVEQFGDFMACFKDPKYAKITISVKDTPNFKEGREIIPGVSGRDYEERIRLQYGEDSDQYRIRILGEPPTQSMGAIYGREIAEVLKFGRLCNVPYDASYPVYTFSDLGIDDPTAIWFMQYIGKEVHCIDYYEASNVGCDVHWRELQNKPYAYAKHYPPFDAANRSPQTGVSYVDFARRLGWKLESALPRVDKLPGIELVRPVLRKSWFDLRTKLGFDAVQAYRWVKNERMSTEDHPVYHDEPLDDWTSHACDALRYGSYVIQLHPEWFYRPRQFEYPGQDHTRPMKAKNLMYSRVG